LFIHSDSSLPQVDKEPYGIKKQHFKLQERSYKLLETSEVVAKAKAANIKE
jgi:hypothetical protein